MYESNLTLVADDFMALDYYITFSIVDEIMLYEPY